MLVPAPMELVCLLFVLHCHMLPSVHESDHSITLPTHCFVVGASIYAIPTSSLMGSPRPPIAQVFKHCARHLCFKVRHPFSNPHVMIVATFLMILKTTSLPQGGCSQSKVWGPPTSHTSWHLSLLVHMLQPWAHQQTNSLDNLASCRWQIESTHYDKAMELMVSTRLALDDMNLGHLGEEASISPMERQKVSLTSNGCVGLIGQIA